MEHIYFSVLSSNFEVMFYSLAEDWSDDDIYYVHPMMADIKMCKVIHLLRNMGVTEIQLILMTSLLLGLEKEQNII